MGKSRTSANDALTKTNTSSSESGWSKGPLGEPPLPAVPRQGTRGPQFTKTPRVDDKFPDGHQEASWDMEQPLRRGIYPTPQGGTGDGPNKGDRLPL